MRIALIQFNPTIGDLEGNASAMVNWIDRARGLRADLIVFPELSLTGYPPRDLLNQEGFVEDARDASTRIAESVGAETVIIGTPWKPPRTADNSNPIAFESDAPVTNSLLALRHGAALARYDKRLLPTYDVFDEDRYFRAGISPVVIEVKGLRIGLSVCEDLWKGADAEMADRYAGKPDPVQDLVRAGAKLILNPSASPFVLGKHVRQREILEHHVRTHRVAIAAVNQVGGNDDLIFSGHAAIYVPDGDEPKLVAAGTGFKEELVCFDLPDSASEWDGLRAAGDPLAHSEQTELLFDALTLGVRDYCRKTGFRDCIVGLSGGIDSAVTGCIAAAAVGAEHVTGVLLPSRYSSPGSIEDARSLGEALEIRLAQIPIHHCHAAVERSIAAPFSELGFSEPHDITDQNIQSRLRGLLLMAVSNRTGALLLTTGNKSEVAVGYCTLYGDMNGGLAVLSDVTKANVYRLAHYINSNPKRCGFKSAPIPESTIHKVPSAELKPGQTDQDTLPPYDVIDQIIERYVEKRQSPARIVRETGIDAGIVAKVVRWIDLSEHKRKQLAIGLKVSSVAFGRGRRRPIAQAYHPERGLTQPRN